MRIESLIRRNGGTKIDLDDATYHFKPTDTDPRHQAEVDVEAHARRLLSITEGYAPLDGASPFPVVKQTGQLNGSQVHAAKYTLENGDVITLDELTSRAFHESGLSFREWNELSDEDRYSHIDTTLAEIRADARPGEKHYDEPDANPEAVATDAGAPPVAETAAVTETPAVIEPKEEQVVEKAPDAKEGATEAADPANKADDKPAETVELDRDKLAAEFEVKFGRKPNGKLSARSIQKALEED